MLFSIISEADSGFGFHGSGSLAASHRILGDSRGNVKALDTVKTRLGEYDKSGRKRPVLTDEVPRIECDGVTLAVGETFDLDFRRAGRIAS